MTISQTMKNDYEVLSPFFLKFAGLCVSIYLNILCLQLFLLNTRFIDPNSPSYQQINVYLIWAIIIGVFILCAFFFIFTFMKVDNSGIYLFNMYLLYYIMCVLFLFILKTRAGTVSNANMMLKIILCLGFIFIFLEFLHAQTSANFVRDKCILAGIMGITPCIVIFVIITYAVYYKRFYAYYMPYHAVAYILYLLYALRIFVFSLLGKEAKTSMLFKCSFIAFLLLWILLTTPQIIGGREPSIINPFSLIIFVAFGCTLLIPLKCKQSADAIINLFQNPLENGIYILVIRFMYFGFLADGAATIWRG